MLYVYTNLKIDLSLTIFHVEEEKNLMYYSSMGTMK